MFYLIPVSFLWEWLTETMYFSWHTMSVRNPAEEGVCNRCRPEIGKPDKFTADKDGLCSGPYPVPWGLDEEGGGREERAYASLAYRIRTVTSKKGSQGVTSWFFQARPSFPSSFFWSGSFILMLYSLAGLTRRLLFSLHLCQWTASSRGVEVVPSPHCCILNTRA